MSKTKLKSTTSGHTKKRRTKTNVSIGVHRYSVPEHLAKKLKKTLSPHLIPNDSEELSLEEVFGKQTDNSGSACLKGLRHRENMTQVQFAEVLGITQTNLSAMENGRRPIGKEMAKRIEKVFKVDYRIFL